MLRGMIEYMKDPKGITERHQLLSPKLSARLQRGTSRDVAEAVGAKGNLEKKLYGGKSSFKEVMMKPIQFMDKQTVSMGMQGAVLQFLDEIKGDKELFSREIEVALDMTAEEVRQMSEADQLRLAYRWADYATDYTQPQFRPEHRTGLSRGKPLARMVTMFSGFTAQALNSTIGSIADVARNADNKQAWGRLGRTLFSTMVVAPLGALLIDRLRDRAYGRESEGFGEEWIDQLMGYAVIFRDLYQGVKRGMKYHGIDPLTSPVADSLEHIPNAMIEFLKAVDGEEGALREGIDEATNFITKMAGIPYPVFSSMIKGLIRGSQQESEPRRF